MLIEFELQGSKLLHKGIFDTNGFWVKFDSDYCDISKVVVTYKIYSHFSFTFEHVEEHIAKEVYKGLCNALSGIDFQYPSVGFIREVI